MIIEHFYDYSYEFKLITIYWQSWYDYWWIIVRLFLILKIILGGKCDIYITQREALASSIEKYWVYLRGEGCFAEQ